VRAYPAGVLRGLLALSREPLVLRQLAEQPELMAQPEKIEPPIPSDLHTAVRGLRRVPEVVMLAAAYPDALASLRRLYAEAPEGMEIRLAELQQGYELAALAGERSWQRLLQSNTAALDAYRELLRRFCQDQVQQYYAFPHVEVLQREYYYACPPNDLVLAYAAEQRPPEVLREIMERWWAEHSPEQVDARLLNGRSQSRPVIGPPDFLAALPPDQRAAMWQKPEAGRGPVLGLVPIIMQPAADQPPDARLAFAVAEHARLWAPLAITEEPVVVMEEPEAPLDADDYVPWTEVIAAGEVHGGDLRYGDTPIHERDYDRSYARVYGGSDRIVTGGVRISYNTYRNSYGNVYPYYCGYPWTWPLLTDGPCWSAQNLCGSALLGYGPQGYVSYSGSTARMCFNVGGGLTYYYNCPISTRHYRKRYWTEHPYQPGYGGYRDPYHSHYGTVVRTRTGHVQRRVRHVTTRTRSVRRQSAAPRSGVRVRRPSARSPSRSGAVVRPSSRGGTRPAVRSGSRTPVMRQPRQPVRRSSSGRTIVRPPSQTTRRSGNYINRPSNRSFGPRRGSSVRPSERRSTPARRPAIRSSPSRGSRGRSPAVRPSSTRRSSGSRIRSATPANRGSSRSAVQRPSSTIRRSPARSPSRGSSRSGIQRGATRTGPRKVIGRSPAKYERRPGTGRRP
jgi:hypothetical protein